MADSVLGDVLQSALADDDVVGLPAAFAGMSVADVREAFAALAEVGSPGVATAASKVASDPADSVDDLLRVAGRTPIPTLSYTSDEVVLAGVVEPTDLDHRVPLELSGPTLDATLITESHADLELSIDSAAVPDIDLEFIGDTALDDVDHDLIEESSEEALAATEQDDPVVDLREADDSDDDDSFDGLDGFA